MVLAMLTIMLMTLMRLMMMPMGTNGLAMTHGRDIANDDDDGDVDDDVGDITDNDNDDFPTHKKNLDHF